MIHLVFFLLAIFMPWILGFAIIKLFLEKRNGYLPFAIGSGYVLGWFLVTLILQVYDYYQRLFDIYELVEVGLALMLFLSLIRSGKSYIVGFQEKEIETRLVWFLSGIVIFLFLYRWGLSAIDLVSKPVFAWDGWWAWTAKAKIFYYYQGIPELSDNSDVFWLYSNTVIAKGINDPYFISLIQTYTALAWGDEWIDGVVNLPWLGLSIAVFFCIYGGLRYLGAGMLPAVLTCYAAVSLPVFDAHISLGSYADVWIGVTFTISVFLLLMLLDEKKWQLFILLFVFLLIAYWIKHTSIVFIVPFCFVLFYCFAGKVVKIVAVFFSALVLCLLWNYSVLFQDVLSFVLKDVKISFNPVGYLALRESMVLDNWHYVIIATFSPFFLIKPLFERKKSKFFILLVVAIMMILIMLFLTFFTTKMMNNVFIGYFNRVILYFIFVIVLVPANVYCAKKIFDNY